MQFLYFIYKIFGIFPYTLFQDGVNPMKKVSVPWFVYSVFFAITYTGFHIFVVLNFLERSSTQFNFVSVLVYIYNSYSGIIWVVILVIAGLIKHKKVVEAYEILAVCDKEFHENLTITVTDAKFKQYQYLQNGVLCLGFVLLEGTINTFELREYKVLSILCNVISLLPPIISTLVETQFIGFTQLIHERYLQINKLIYKYRSKVIEENEDKYFSPLNQNKLSLSETNTKPLIFISELYSGLGKDTTVVAARKRIFLDEKINYNEKLRYLEVIYTRLYHVSQLVDSAYGIQIVIILTIHFIQLTTLLYGSCQLLITYLFSQTEIPTSIANNFGKLLFTRLLWVVMFLYKTFTLCLNSHRATKEAKHVGSYLHHFGFNTDDLNEKTHVKLFSLKVLQQKVIFMPCGMFQVDLKLMFMIIGAVATYILILIQFDVALKTNTTQTGNTTQNSTQI